MELTGDARTLWDAAVALARAAPLVSGKATPGRPLPPMLFFTDPGRTPCPWLTAARLPAGSAVVYRHFGAADSMAVAKRLRAITRERDVVLLIGLDADLAVRIGADGIHLPARALDQADAFRARRPDWLLTGAIHDPAVTPHIAALDALVLSPIFAAGGASSSKTPLGPGAIQNLRQRTEMPVYALGGLNAATATTLGGSGACGFAAVEAIQAAFGQAAFAAAGPSARTRAAGL